MITTQTNELSTETVKLLPEYLLEDILTDFNSGAKIIKLNNLSKEFVELVENIPINNLSMKTIYKSNNSSLVDEIMLTIDNHLIAYSKGLPSLLGMPAEHDIVSCFYKGIDELLDYQSKAFNLFTEDSWLTYSLLFNQLSFNPVDISTIMKFASITSFSSKVTNIYSPKGYPFDYFYNMPRGKYHKYYPRFDDKRFLDFRDFLTSK